MIWYKYKQINTHGIFFILLQHIATVSMVGTTESRCWFRVAGMLVGHWTMLWKSLVVSLWLNLYLSKQPMKKAQSFISNKVLIQVSKQQPRKIIEQAGWFLRPDCAPRSECPSSRICGQNPRNDADATFLDPHISVVDCRSTPPRRQYCRCTLRSAGGCRNGKLQNVSPPSVLFQSSWIFFTIHRRYRRKNDGPEFWNSNSVIFEIFF